MNAHLREHIPSDNTGCENSHNHDRACWEAAQETIESAFSKNEQ